MKIAIFSDLHDNLNNLKLFAKEINKLKVNIIIFTGDLTNNNSLEALANYFKQEIYLVSGNADLYKLKPYKNLKYLGDKNIIIIDKLKIALSHFPEIAKSLIIESQEKLDFAFCGHTHKPHLEIINNTYLINPGTLNCQISPTYTILNTKNKKFELKKLCLKKTI